MLQQNNNGLTLSCQQALKFFRKQLFYATSILCLSDGDMHPISQPYNNIGKQYVFSARCNIYISHLCLDVSVHLSVRLSVTFVHCGHRVQWIPDIFACLDRWMSLLLTDNASPGSSDGMMPGFLVEEGGMEKLVIVAISLILLTESLDRKHVTVVFISTMLTQIFL